MRIAETVGSRDWLVFLSLVQAPGEEEPEERFQQLTGKLTLASVTAFELGPPPAGAATDGVTERQQAKEVAKRTYAQSVAVSKEVIHSVRMGRAPNIKKIKRVVQ